MLSFVHLSATSKNQIFLSHVCFQSDVWTQSGFSWSDATAAWALWDGMAKAKLQCEDDPWNKDDDVEEVDRHAQQPNAHPVWEIYGIGNRVVKLQLPKLQNSPLSMCAVNPSLLRNLMRNLVGQVPTKPRRVYQRPQLSPFECLAPPPPGSSLPFEKKSHALSYWNSDRPFFPNGNLNELCQLWDFFVLEGTPNWWRNLSIHGMMRYVFHSLLETLLLTIAHYGTAGASYLVSGCKWVKE